MRSAETKSEISGLECLVFLYHPCETGYPWPVDLHSQQNGLGSFIKYVTLEEATLC